MILCYLILRFIKSGGGELKETTGDLFANSGTVRVPVTGIPVALVIVNNSYFLNYIGLNTSQLAAVYLFNGKASTNPSGDVYKISVLFNGDSELLITNARDTPLYYRYIELV